MPKKYSWYFLTIVLFILGLSIGFFTGKQLATAQNSASSQSSAKEETGKLFSSQTASLRAEITNIEGNKLTVKNLNNAAIGDINTSSKISILKPGKATPSSDLSSIELNKEVLISLEMIGGVWQAVIIQYPSPLPSLPPAASFKPDASPQPRTP